MKVSPSNTTPPSRPDRDGLEHLAFLQDGYFTADQASEYGFSHQLLAHHAKTGWLERRRRGLYRLSNYPSSPHEEVRAAWLALARGRAVVSHETALQLLDLADVLPAKVHLTVPRTSRGLTAPDGVALHTTTGSQDKHDIVNRAGLPVSAPYRAILEAAAAGAQPEQIEEAIREALRRGLTTRRQLDEESKRYSQRVRELVSHGVEAAKAS